MKIYYTLFFCFLTTAVFQLKAQSFIGKKKREIVLIDGATFNPSLVFNEKNICIREIYEHDSLEDCNKQVAKIFQDTSYGWIRINENQIVSNFSHQRLIEILEINKGCRVQIHQTAWTKELYNLLLNN
mgnify:CR=1 FL=1